MNKPPNSRAGSQILSSMVSASSPGEKARSIGTSTPLSIQSIGRSQQLHDLLDKLKAIQIDLLRVISETKPNEKETTKSLHVILGAAMTHLVALDLVIVESDQGRPIDMSLVKNASNFCDDVLTSFETMEPT